MINNQDQLALDTKEERLQMENAPEKQGFFSRFFKK